MNLVWTPQSGKDGKVIGGENIAAYLIAKGSAVDLDAERQEIDAMVQEAGNAPSVSKTYKVKPTKKKKK
jgi:hypothetical protein